MYIHSKIIANLITLFKESPEYRDDKWGTIRKVTNLIKLEHDLTDELSTMKIAVYVDRTFRYVQQHFPELRGKKWIERQKMAGAMRGDFASYKTESERIQYIQKSLFEDED